MKTNQINNIKNQLNRLYLCGDSYPHYTQKIGKLSAGLFVEKCQSGKPAELKSHYNGAMNNYLFIINIEDFCANGSYFSKGVYIAELTSTGNAKGCRVSTRGKASKVRDLWNNKDAETLRKSSAVIFWVGCYPLYDENDKAKQEQRQNNRPDNERAENLKRANGGDHYNTRPYYWGSSRTIYIDKNGYNLTDRREQLAHRLKEYKHAKKCQEWANSDKAEQVAKWGAFMDELKSHTINQLNEGVDFYHRNRVEELMKLYERAEKVRNTYQSNKTSDPETFAEKVQKLTDDIYIMRLLLKAGTNAGTYGACLWELEPGKKGGIVNAYKLKNNSTSDKDYYLYINADGVASYER